MKIHSYLFSITLPLLAALPAALAANVCTATLEEQDKPLWNRFRSIVTCSELDRGCSFRASCDFPSALDTKSEWTSVVGATMTTGWQENWFPAYGNPNAKWDIECRI